MEGWLRSDSLPHLYKLDRKIQALSKKCNEVQAELSLAKVDQQRLCSQLREQNETIKDVRELMMKAKAETESDESDGAKASLKMTTRSLPSTPVKNKSKPQFTTDHQVGRVVLFCPRLHIF